MRLIEDAVERNISVPERPARIVSLVPSVTELLFDLGAGDRVVGCSRYCTEPTGGLDGVARVGGQKDPELDAIVALAPDLVIAVKEENLRRDVQALSERGIAVYVGDVISVEGAIAFVGELADLVGAEPSISARLLGQMREGIEAARRIAAGHAPLPIFCPIWRDPWIAVGPDTYISDVIHLCGGRPVPQVARGDRRYPKVLLEEVRAAAPRLVLLPDEPYPFAAADAEELAPIAPSHPCSGKLLCWYGRRTAGIVELARRIDDAAHSMPTAS